MPRRRRRKNPTQDLIRLIAVLVAVLAIVVIIAVMLHNGKEAPDTVGGNSTKDTQSQIAGKPGRNTEPDDTTETEGPEETKESLQSTEPLPQIPDYGEYTDVGTGYIAEVITYTAETFNGLTSDDYSAPIRNYLPEGTVDYASTKTVSNSTMDYILLRCGRRVYVKKNNLPSSVKLPVVECYAGTLPDHNEIGFVSVSQEDHFTILTLDVLWKAPFYVNIAPQEYRDPSHRDYRVTDFTAEYIDITFCYATSFTGTVDLGKDNPLFRYAVAVQGESDCTLRLYLKETGAFYGYDSYYNENDQLCFKFLNPVAAAATSDNSYGADLTGIRIMIDVGHGGVDVGTVATASDGRSVYESNLNLSLAKVLCKELESMGATVILNRTDDSVIRVDDRTKMLKDIWPDICISIHQNSCPEDSSVSGFQMCYSTPFSYELGMLMYDHTMDAGIYKEGSTSWHYYYVAKQTNCPVVLMECGYVSNARDLANMESRTVLQQKAQAMAAAVAEYFLNMG